MRYLLFSFLLSLSVYGQTIQQTRYFENEEDQSVRDKVYEAYSSGNLDLLTDSLKRAYNEAIDRWRANGGKYKTVIVPTKGYTLYADTITNPEKITKLTIDSLDKRWLPDLSAFQNLEELEIINSEIRVLPFWLRKNKKLEFIAIHGPLANRKIRFSRWGARPEELMISYASPELIPRNFNKHKKSLQKLTLVHNEIEELRFRIDRCSKMQTLNLSHNILSPQQDRFSGHGTLTEVELNGTSCAVFPEWIDVFPQVEVLKFRQSAIPTITAKIGELSKLQDISFYEGSLTYIDPAMANCTLMAVMDLYYNQLTELPVFFTTFDSLEILYMSYNELTRIPDEIGNLRRLEELYLHHNKLTNLPASLGELPLRVLRINDNYLQEFPDMITGIETLEELDLSGNDFNTISSRLTELDRLRYLNLKRIPFYRHYFEGQEFNDIVAHIRAQGTIVNIPTPDNE